MYTYINTKINNVYINTIMHTYIKFINNEFIYTHRCTHTHTHSHAYTHASVYDVGVTSLDEFADCS